MNGLFITFEGIEGVGKTTLQVALGEALAKQHFEVVLTREPGGTPLGERLRNTVLAAEIGSVTPMAELLIMFASRAEHVESFIKPALKEGRIVLCDRFSDASYAYQSGGRGISRHYLDALVNMTHPTLQPDLTFWLDLSPQEALARAEKRSTYDRIEQERIDFFQRVADFYLEIADAEPHRVIRLDASLPPAALLKTALDHLSLKNKTIFSNQ